MKHVVMTNWMLEERRRENCESITAVFTEELKRVIHNPRSRI